MLDRAISSVRKRGVVGTAKLAVESAAGRIFDPKHLRDHLLVPVEMMKHPSHVKYWVTDRIRTARAIDQGVPWISWPCIDFLKSQLKPEFKVFEYGGGGSTVFFLKRVARLVTIESNEYWKNQLAENLSPELKRNWELRFVKADSNDADAKREYIESVATGGPWDVVLVDGWNRQHCAEAAREFVKPGGILVFDNSNKPQFAGVPDLFKDWKRLEFQGLGPARSWITKTDAYVKKA
jgi:hypothetical protein